MGRWDVGRCDARWVCRKGKSPLSICTQRAVIIIRGLLLSIHDDVNHFLNIRAVDCTVFVDVAFDAHCTTNVYLFSGNGEVGKHIATLIVYETTKGAFSLAKTR